MKRRVHPIFREMFHLAILIALVKCDYKSHIIIVIDDDIKKKSVDGFYYFKRFYFSMDYAIFSNIFFFFNCWMKWGFSFEAFIRVLEITKVTLFQFLLESIWNILEVLKGFLMPKKYKNKHCMHQNTGYVLKQGEERGGGMF